MEDMLADLEIDDEPPLKKFKLNEQIMVEKPIASPKISTGKSQISFISIVTRDHRPVLMKEDKSITKGVKKGKGRDSNF